MDWLTALVAREIAEKSPLDLGEPAFQYNSTRFSSPKGESEGLNPG